MLFCATLAAGMLPMPPVLSSHTRAPSPQPRPQVPPGFRASSDSAHAPCSIISATASPLSLSSFAPSANSSAQDSGALDSGAASPTGERQARRGCARTAATGEGGSTDEGGAVAMDMDSPRGALPQRAGQPLGAGPGAASGQQKQQQEDAEKGAGPFASFADLMQALKDVNQQRGAGPSGSIGLQVPADAPESYRLQRKACMPRKCRMGLPELNTQPTPYEHTHTINSGNAANDSMCRRVQLLAAEACSVCSFLPNVVQAAPPPPADSDDEDDDSDDQLLQEDVCMHPTKRPALG